MCAERDRPARSGLKRAGWVADGSRVSEVPAARAWVHRHSPWRSVALYTAALVPLTAALRDWSWYSLALAVSLMLAGYTLAGRRRWAGFLLLWFALMLVLLLLFYGLGPAHQVLGSVIVLGLSGAGLLVLTGRSPRRG
jgi:hypothetical protein